MNSGLENNSFTNYYDERIPLSEYKELYKGHEVACHTATHPTIARCPREQIVLQVMEDRTALEKIMGTTIRGMAYPNGSFSDEVVDVFKSCGIVHARTVNATHSFDMPTDFLRWNPTCRHADPELMKLGKEFTDLHKTQYFYMFYVWGHSYEFERDNNWEIIEEFAAEISGHDDIWYATNIEICDYVKGYKSLIYSANGNIDYNPSLFTIWIDVG